MRRFPCLIAAIILFFLPGITYASEEFSIERFDSTIQVHEDSLITVGERLVVDFGANERHGIYRIIPTTYNTDTGTKRSIRLRDVAVSNGENQSVPFELQRDWSSVTVKIGDPDEFVTGEQVYNISYSVNGVLNFFDDHAELYWNATGNGWDTVIAAASATVILPQSASNLRAQAFEGLVGSVEPARASNKGNQFQFETTRALQSGEGLTIVAGWPLGIVEPPSAWTKAMWFLLDNGILVLPLIVLVWVIWYFRRHGKDPFGRGTIAPKFGPPKALSLLEQAALRDERLQARDLSALIVSWAVDGFITIEEPKKNEITLVRQKELSGRPDYELQFFSKVFSGASDNRAQLTKLAGKLQTPAHNLRMAVFRDLVKKGYFVANPQTVRAVWLVGGFGLLMVSWILGALLGLPWLIAFAVSGLIVLAAAPLMPQRTHEGVLAKEQVEGFELYLKTAERYRMEFYEKEKVFERYLPYAMAFGVATIWAKAFGDIAKSAPSWYTGYYGTHWVPLQFAQGLENTLQSNMNTAMTTASSGGSGFSGGFSGGGFGGGGGGSW